MARAFFRMPNRQPGSVYILPLLRRNRPLALRYDGVKMPVSSPPPRRRPLSPSLSSRQGAPPPVRRRLFSTPIQPPSHDPPPPPHHALSFKVKSDATAKSPLPSPRHVLSFKISGTNTSQASTFNSRSNKCMFFLCALTRHSF